MNIYKISQEVNNGWDTYDSAVVVAETVEEARRTDPSNFFYWHEESKVSGWWEMKCVDGSVAKEEFRYDWSHIKDVKVEKIGVADEGIKKGVIVASFNAG